MHIRNSICAPPTHVSDDNNSNNNTYNNHNNRNEVYL